MAELGPNFGRTWVELWLNFGRTSVELWLILSDLLSTFGCGPGFCYRVDRLVTPGELMRAHGWTEHVHNGKAVSMSGVPFSKGMDLAGECMALQNIGAALWALIMAAGTTVLRDVWQPSLESRV